MGEVWKLELSDTSRFCATSRPCRPTCWMRVRSMLTASVGWSKRWCTCVSTAPGIRRMRLARMPASCWLAATSAPENCTSMADGSPKLRIWLTMSAGWKANSTPGKRLGSSSRRRRTYSALGLRSPSRSAIRISPSSVPMVPALLYDRLMPELGTPRLSRSVASSLRGMMVRMAASTSSARRAVSSMRRPDGARMCRRIWPASTSGKKSRPSAR